MNKIKALYKKNKEVINYVLVGGLTTLVSLLSYYIIVTVFLNPKDSMELQLANVMSWICAVAFAYIANRKYVFESHNNTALELIHFIMARVSTLIIDMICMAIFVSTLMINDKISKIIVQFIVFALNYIFSKFFVFKKKRY